MDVGLRISGTSLYRRHGAKCLEDERRRNPGRRHRYPRNYWTSETLTNNSVMAGYVGGCKRLSASERLPLFDLNAAIVNLYTSMGRTAVSAYFTSGDNTHTNVLGATQSARAALEGVRTLSGSNLRTFLSN